MEIGNLHEKEFRVMIVKTIQDLGKRMKAQMKKIEEMFNNALEALRRELNNAITEI